MQFKIFGSVVLAAVATGLAASAAQASFVAQFSADGGPITSFTGTGGYISQSNFTVGSFSIGNYTAQSDSGSSQTPQISAFSVDVTNSNPSTVTDVLDINLWDTGFAPPGSLLTLAGSGSVTFNVAANGDSATFQSGADPADGQFSLSTVAPPVLTPASSATYTTGMPLPITIPLSQQTATFSPNGTNPFSMGNNLELSLAGGSNVTLSYTTTAVPEPATLGLLAVGGLGLLVGKRRKRGGSPRNGAGS